LFRLDPAGGQAMITRFECRNVLNMLVVLALHMRIKRDVRHKNPGFLGIVLLRQWRSRTVLSISLWRDIDSVYGMGRVDRHIAAARVPGKLRIATRCGVFCYSGDWRQVMFGAGQENPSPILPKSKE
jgi:hypothetical protein